MKKLEIEKQQIVSFAHIKENLIKSIKDKSVSIWFGKRDAIHLVNAAFEEMDGVEDKWVSLSEVNALTDDCVHADDIGDIDGDFDNIIESIKATQEYLQNLIKHK